MSDLLPPVPPVAAPLSEKKCRHVWEEDWTEVDGAPHHFDGSERCRYCKILRPAPPNHAGVHLRLLLELDGPQPAPIRVAAFLRQYASIIRKQEHWDVPETMANAYESAAKVLEEYLQGLGEKPR